jgi:predicted Zn-dependent protease
LPNQAEEIKASLLDIIQNDDLKLRQCQKGVLKKLNEQPNNAFLNELLIWIYTLKNDWDQALVLEEALDTRLQENGQRIFKFIDLALKNNALKPAEEALNYLSSNANRVDAHFVLLKRLAISQSQLKASLGNDTVVRHTLNNLFSQLQKDTIRFFDEGTALDYVSYLTQYEHQYKKALQLVNMCIDRYADQRSLEGNAKLWKGDLLLLLNKPWEASLLYSQVEKAFREDALGEEARYKNAKLAYYTGEFEWAEGQLSVLKTATSELIANDALKLSMLIIENKTNDSVNIAMQAYAKADLFLFQNKPKEALQLIDSICTLNPSHPLQDDFLFLKASVLKSINDFDGAILALEKIKKEYANDVLADDALNELATIYVYLKKDANAKVCYEELIEKYPGSTFVNNARLFLNKK